MQTDSNQFWGNLPELSPEFAAAAIARFTTHQENLRTTQRHNRMRRSWMMYYSKSRDGAWDDTEVQTAGERGELTVIKPARYRMLIQHQLALITQSPPSYEAQALNTDAESQEQTGLAVGILGYYTRVAHLEDLGIKRAEYALVLGESFLHVRWDVNTGREFGVRDVTASDGSTKQQPAYEGDFVFSVGTPYDYAYDPQSPDLQRPRWGIMHEPVSRWDLLAQYGADSSDIEQAIRRAPKWSSFQAEWKFEAQEYAFDDSIAVYWVYIERCSACPDGRKALVLDDKTVLFDGPLDEERSGVFRMAPSDVIFQAGGYTNNFDGMPLVEAYQAQTSTILSNHATFALQRLIVARRANVKHFQLSEGIAVVDFDHVDPQSGVQVPEPHVAQFLATPQEVFTFHDLLSGEIDDVMQVSPVLRGDPNATKGDSGAKYAALYSAGQQFANGYVRNKARSDEDVATFLISSLQRHATTPRITSIAGKNNTFASKQFTNKDLRGISRVLVTAGNAMRDTFAGRMELADKLIPLPPEQREQYQAVISTGRTEPITDDANHRRMLIERENELLRNEEGPMPVALASDNHVEHYMRHDAGLADPDVRRNPKILARHEQHKQEHLDKLTQGHPNYAGDYVLMVTGQKPLPVLGSGARAPGPPGEQASAATPPPAAAQGAPPQPGEQKPPSSGPAEMPKMPTDPTTGQQMPAAGQALEAPSLPGA